VAKAEENSDDEDDSDDADADKDASVDEDKGKTDEMCYVVPSYFDGHVSYLACNSRMKSEKVQIW